MANKNSNWPTNAQPDITPDEMAAQVRAMEKIRELPKIDYSDPQEIENRIKFFFEFCAENNLRPTVELMALCIGVSRMALWRWEQEGKERGEIISSAKQVLAAMMEQWGVRGKINPAAMCFLMKNHFHYADTYQIEPVQQNNLDSLPSAQDIRRRIPQNIQTDESEPDLLELLEE